MPRQRKRPNSIRAVAPISAEELAEMLRKAVAPRRLPAPDGQSCELIAQALNANRDFGKGFALARSDKKLQRAYDAARLLHSFCADAWCEREGTLYRDDLWGRLEQSIERTLPLFRLMLGVGTKMRRAAPWCPLAFVTYEIGSLAFAEAGLQATPSRRNAAVRFTALALNRMGFEGATPAAIERVLSKKPTTIAPG